MSQSKIKVQPGINGSADRPKTVDAKRLDTQKKSRMPRNIEVVKDKQQSMDPSRREEVGGSHSPLQKSYSKYQRQLKPKSNKGFGRNNNQSPMLQGQDKSVDNSSKNLVVAEADAINIDITRVETNNDVSIKNGAQDNQDLSIFTAKKEEDNKSQTVNITPMKLQDNDTQDRRQTQPKPKEDEKSQLLDDKKKNLKKKQKKHTDTNVTQIVEQNDDYFNLDQQQSVLVNEDQLRNVQSPTSMVADSKDEEPVNIESQPPAPAELAESPSKKSVKTTKKSTRGDATPKRSTIKSSRSKKQLDLKTNFQTAPVEIQSEKTLKSSSTQPDLKGKSKVNNFKPKKQPKEVPRDMTPTPKASVPKFRKPTIKSSRNPTRVVSNSPLKGTKTPSNQLRNSIDIGQMQKKRRSSFKSQSALQNKSQTLQQPQGQLRMSTIGKKYMKNVKKIKQKDAEEEESDVESKEDSILAKYKQSLAEDPVYVNQFIPMEVNEYTLDYLKNFDSPKKKNAIRTLPKLAKKIVYHQYQQVSHEIYLVDLQKQQQQLPN